MEPEHVEKLLHVLEIRCESPMEHRALVESLAKTIKDRFGRRVLPPPGESLALSVMTPKTAALAFDRVYKIPAHVDPVPDSIGFYGATLPEIVWWAGGLLAISLEELGIPALRLGKGPGSPESERANLRLLCSEFPGVFGAMPTIFYHSAGNQTHDFPVGTHQVLTAVIRNLALVDEKNLTWEQVIEFRKDAAARAKYRRIVRWIDVELATQSPKAVEDMIAIRLDDYEWALKKHGLRATMGALSCLLDPKFLATTTAATAATSLTAGNAWAALAAAALTGGHAMLSFGSVYVDGLDEQRKTNYEVAYVHQLAFRRFSGERVVAGDQAG